AISVLSLLSMVLLARSGSGAQAAGAVGQAVSATRQIAYSRQLEMEADTLGVRYMANWLKSSASFRSSPEGTITRKLASHTDQNACTAALVNRPGTKETFC